MSGRENTLSESSRLYINLYFLYPTILYNLHIYTLYYDKSNIPQKNPLIILTPNL